MPLPSGPPSPAPPSPRTALPPSGIPTSSSQVLSTAKALDAGDDLRKKLDLQLQKTTQLLYEMEVTAGFVVAERQDFLENSVAQLIRSYETLCDLASGMTDTVPTETMIMIDEGVNPHEYTKKTLNGVLTSSQWANGKVQAFESYRSLLSTMITEQFPDMGDLPPSVPVAAGLSLPDSVGDGNAVEHDDPINGAVKLEQQDGGKGVVEGDIDMV